MIAAAFYQQAHKICTDKATTASNENSLFLRHIYPFSFCNQSYFIYCLFLNDCHAIMTNTGTVYINTNKSTPASNVSFSCYSFFTFENTGLPNRYSKGSKFVR